MNRVRLVVFVVILVISIGQSVDIYVPSMPVMATDLSTTNGMIQWSIAIGLIGFGLSVFIWGALSDYFGRRIPLLAGVALFAIGSAICFFAQNIYVLLLGRAVQGCGIGCAGISPSLPQDVCEGAQLIRAYSKISIALSVAPVIAPVFGGYLQHWIGWRANFAFLGIYAAIVFLFIYWKLPETIKHRTEEPFSFTALVRRYLSLLNSRTTWVNLFCLIAITAGELAYCVSLPFIAQKALGFNPVSTGWLIMITAIGLAIGAFFSSRASFLGWKKLLLLGLVISSFGSIAMLLLALYYEQGILVLVGSMMIYMIGAGLIYPNVITGLMEAYPKQSGTMSSLLSGSEMLGAGLVIVLISYFPQQDFLALAFSLTALTLSSLLLQRIGIQKLQT